MGFTRFPNGLNIRLSCIVGSTAGNFTLTGISLADELMSVIKVRQSTGGIAWNSTDDLTTEFSISAANTITNTGGTSSSLSLLLVLWADADRKSING